MHRELWSPESSSPEHYGLALGGHGWFSTIATGAPVLVGIFGYAVVPELAGGMRMRVPALGWCGVLLWAAGLVAGVVAVVSPPAYGAPGVRTELVSAGLVAASGVVCALHVGAMLVARVRGGALGRSALVTGAVFVIACAAASVLGVLSAITRDTSHESVMWILKLTWLAAAVVATAALARPTSSVLLVITALAGAALWMFAEVRLGCLITVAAWVVLLVEGGWRRPGAIFIMLGAIPASLGLAMIQGFLLGADVFLHDTYFVVGQHHAFAAMTAFAALAGLHSWASQIVGLIPRGWVVMVGGTIACAGFAIHTLMLLALGARGMPRRYFRYDEMFESLHHGATLGAVICGVGVVCVLVAWCWPDRPVTPPAARP